jgi:hypothetical protein
MVQALLLLLRIFGSVPLKSMACGQRSANA